MKRVITLAAVLTMLAINLTACGLSFETAEVENHSSEEHVSEPAETSEPTPTPEPTATPKPELEYLTDYNQLTEENRAVLETLAEETIDAYFSETETETIDIFQARTATGPGRPSPRTEDYLNCEAELDAVYVLSAAEYTTKPKNRIVFLYLATANFREYYPVPETCTPESLDYYFVVSMDNVEIKADGAMEFEQDSIQMLLELDPHFYDFFDLYEETILPQGDMYTIEETVVSDEHAERMESRVMEDNWLHSQMPLDMWSSLFNNRHMIEADIRRMDAEQLGDRLAAYKAFVEERSADEQLMAMLPEAKENMEYNLAFLDEHLAKLPQEPTPEPKSQDVSAFTGTWSVDPIKTNEMNSESLMLRFGSMIKTSSMEMTVGESGYFIFGLGGEGGEGSYTIEGGEIIATYCSYNTETEQEITKHIPMVEEDGTVYLVMTFRPDNYQVYWKK